MRILSPSFTNAGTVTTRPVSIVAGFTCAAAVAPLMPGHGIRHLEVDRQRQVDADRLGLVELHADLRLRQQVQRLIAERLLRQVDLLVGLRVHEVEDVAVPIEELHLVLIERGALHVVFRPELVVHQPAIADVPQLAHGRGHACCRA